MAKPSKSSKKTKSKKVLRDARGRFIKKGTKVVKKTNAGIRPGSKSSARRGATKGYKDLRITILHERARAPKKQYAEVNEYDDPDSPFFGWLPTRIGEPQWLREDFTLAMHPSRLRHTRESGKLRELLKGARDVSDEDFQDMADSMAQFYDLPIQEIYTLFLSP